MTPIVKLALLMVLVTQLSAQHKVTFNLTDNSALQHDSIYLSGSFNDWITEANKDYLLKPFGNKRYSISISVPKGEIQYKYHRGNWSSVEKSFFGNEVANRIIFISKDTVLNDVAASWLDDFIVDKHIAISNAAHDSTLLYNYSALANVYAYYDGFYNLDSATHYANEAKLIIEKINLNSKYKFSSANNINNDFLRLMQEINASIFHSSANYSKSLELRLDNLRLAEESQNVYAISDVLWSIASLYASMKDYKRMLECGIKMYVLLEDMDSGVSYFGHYNYMAHYTIVSAHCRLNDYNKALDYARKLEKIYVATNSEWFNVRTQVLLGELYVGLNQYDLALDYYEKAEKGLNEQASHFVALAWLGKAKIYQKNNQLNSALINAKKAYTFFTTNKLEGMVSGGWGENSNYYISETSPILSELFYTAGYPDSAYHYLKLYVSVSDTLFSNEKTNQFREQIFSEQSRKQKQEIESHYLKKEFDNQLKFYGLIICIVVFIILFIMQYKNIRHKNKMNIILNGALDNLKSTQSQLIQSEKMASLGELTAGIAHEIQNPLNFVNNFSEVSIELLDEMKQELTRGNAVDANEIADDVIQNLVKINHHGKRADTIVKGMLQHSRKSTGVKELTDINLLAEEYLRLAYHGLRAKDKSFNAEFETDFDPNLPKINVVPQDIGRVLLNLINNAFYAVNEKSKEGKEDYKPCVEVSTRKVEKGIEISVKDNGPGIPDHIKDKIFQPFFTTKPTGQGTGLGLSLSYDIVKAHGGELKVETKEGEGTVFFIRLPFG